MLKNQRRHLDQRRILEVVLQSSGEICQRLPEEQRQKVKAAAKIG